MRIRQVYNIKTIIYQFCTGPLKTLNPTKFIGKLTILPTPIGNLQDLSPNIIKALFRADVIGCQDKRVAGKLYTLIKSRHIIDSMSQNYGQIGLSSIIPVQNNKTQQQKTQQQNNYLFYDYSNMNEKERKKFLRKMTKQQQQKFKIDFLKYRAIKIVQKEDQFSHKQKQDKFDELYGLDSSDLQHIQLQIRNTRIKKGRGLLIPLNTYSQNRMFNLVKMFLQTKNVAIISDAGMPCISDPGWKMVRKIRQSLPQVPIQVIGGPSSVSLMTLLASLSLQNNKNSLSGRFQGFAPEQTSHITQKSIQIEQAKKKQFSIHFINSKKLRKKSLQLQKLYGTNQKVLLANQLTKMYERKYHGTIGQLNTQMSKQNSQFSGIGQLSYIVYPNTQNNIVQKQQNIALNLQNPKSINDNANLSNLTKRISLISLQNFIASIKQAEQQIKKKRQLQQNTNNIGINQNQQQKNSEHSKTDKLKPQRGNQSQVSSKDLIELICSVFGTKSSLAKKMVYQKQIQIKNFKYSKPDSLKDASMAYKKHMQESQSGSIYSQSKQKNQSSSQTKNQQKSNRRLGRRTRKVQQNISSQQLELLKMLDSHQGNRF